MESNYFKYIDSFIELSWSVWNVLNIGIYIGLEGK